MTDPIRVVSILPPTPMIYHLIVLIVIVSIVLFAVAVVLAIKSLPW
jgi:hypothetical protein